MINTLSLAPAERMSIPAPVEVRRGPLWWRCLPEFRGLLENAQVEWFDPVPMPGAESIKQNAHRAVWRMMLGGREFFVKIYRPNGWNSRLKLLLRGPTAVQEWTVGHYAARRQVPAVLPVACGWLGAGGRSGPSLLVTAAVPNALPLCDYWARHGGDFRHSHDLLDVLASLIARAHQSGFYHRDMHAGNILVHQMADGRPEALFVDLHNVGIDRRVPASTVISNLAQLNQWFRRNATRTRRVQFLERYVQYRQQFVGIGSHARPCDMDLRALLKALDACARTHAARLWSKRDRRSMRNGRYFCRLSPARGWSGLAMQQCKHAQPDSALRNLTIDRRTWSVALRDPLSWVSTARTTLLKDSHTATVCRGELPVGAASVPIIIKRPRQRSLLKRLSYLLGRSRNMHTWRMANKLANRDLPAAQPLAVLEKRAMGICKTDSILMTEAVASAGDLESFLTTQIARLPAPRQRVAKERLSRVLVRLLKDFHDRGFVHRDMKATNVLIVAPSNGDALGEPRPVLIDLDGVSHHSGMPNDRTLWRAVTRLNVSLLSCPTLTRTDRLRFLKALLIGPGKSDKAWRATWRLLADQSERKQRDKSQRRRWKMEHYGRE